jgi:hypothetical protein
MTSYVKIMMNISNPMLGREKMQTLIMRIFFKKLKPEKFDEHPQEKT